MYDDNVWGGDVLMIHVTSKKVMSHLNLQQFNKEFLWKILETYASLYHTYHIPL